MKTENTHARTQTLARNIYSFFIKELLVVQGKQREYNDSIYDELQSSRVQKFPALHTKAAPNGKCCEGYIVPSMVRLMYQLKSVLK